MILQTTSGSLAVFDVDALIADILHSFEKTATIESVRLAVVLIMLESFFELLSHVIGKVRGYGARRSMS